MIDAMTLYCVAPAVVKRAERVSFAVDLLKSHAPERTVRQRVQRRYGVSKATAWRTVDMARDLA